MTNESIGPGLWLEVPDHETRVHGAGSQLLHVRVEGYTGDCVSVALKVTLQSWVILR